MKIIKSSFFLFLVLVFSSCSFIKFTAQPGSPRTTFPYDLKGRYYIIDKESKDTFYLTITDTQANSNDNTLNDLLQLTDSTNLTHLGDFYFFNIKDSETNANKTYWNIFPLYLKGDYLYVYTLTKGKLEKKLKKKVKYDASDNSYIMDNESFKTFCEKNLKRRKYKRKASKLIRIK